MKVFFVFGPESSGTRLATQILINGGCVGSAKHRQPFDSGEFPDKGPIVWRRSFPHNNNWPVIPSLVSRLPSSSVVHVVVCMRDQYATARSAHRLRVAYDSTLEESFDTLKFAYRYIYSELDRLGLDYSLLSYESLVLHPRKTQENLWTILDLPGGDLVEIRDENKKHYET